MIERSLLQRIRFALLCAAFGCITGVFFSLLRVTPEIASYWQKPDGFFALRGTDQIDALTRITHVFGARNVWRWLRTAGRTGSTGSIHDLAHLVGTKLFDQEGTAGITACSGEFAYGCYHGFMDRMLTRDMGKLPLATATCAKLGNSRSTAYKSCLHGIGHGIATYTDGSDPDSALERCRAVAGDPAPCFDGVFMEMALSSSVSPDWSGSACTRLAADARASCGRNIPFALRLRQKKTPPEILAACMKESDPDIAVHCVRATAAELSQSVSGDSASVLTFCGQIRSAVLSSACVTAAAEEAAFQRFTNWQKTTGEICGSLLGSDNTICKDRVRDITESQ